MVAAPWEGEREQGFNLIFNALSLFLNNHECTRVRNLGMGCSGDDEMGRKFGNWID